MLAPSQARQIQHELRQRFAAAYAAGALDPALRMLVETQASLTNDASDDLEHAEALAGALLELEAPVSLKPSAMEVALARIAEDPRQETPNDAARMAARRAGAVIDEILHLPNPVQDAALSAIGGGGWTFGGPGLRTLQLKLGGESKAELMRIEPGWRAPRHSHHGQEYTLVLTGGFEDEHAHYGVGDISVAGPGVTHRPAAAPGAICYALAVTEGPLAFTGALGLIQKLWKH